jgi:biopolymer transport protein TolQ
MLPGYFQLGEAQAVPTNIVDMVRHGTALTQGVLIFLLILSLISWTIMVLKWIEFRSVERHGRAFMREIGRAASLDEASSVARRTKPNPFTRVFSRGVNFFAEMRPGALRTSEAGALSAAQVEALKQVLDSQAADERDRLGSYIPSLATIGSASPLIGLLGTVLGIINAFTGIAVTGAGNLAAVAPGVSEALTATAGALTVAIPAVFGYNIFAGRLNRVEGELESFGTGIIAMMVREGRI